MSKLFAVVVDVVVIVVVVEAVGRLCWATTVDTTAG